MTAVLKPYPPTPSFHFMPDSSSNSSGGRSLLREVLIAATCVALGALVLPAAIYIVGTLVLGPYTGGLGKFYQSFFQDLAAGLPRTWTLVLGPYVLISLVRLIFIRRRAPQAAQASSEPETRRAPPPEQVRTTTRVAQARRPVPPPASPPQSPPSQAARPSSKRIEPRISLD